VIEAKHAELARLREEGIDQDRITVTLARYHLPHAIENVILGSIGGALDVAARVGGTIGNLLTHVARSAFISGANLGMVIAAAVALAGCVLTLAFLPRPARRAAGADPSC
jgi:hypothetical protein